ncbi:MAG: response regulator, partial [Myxococcaceae bacterium]
MSRSRDVLVVDDESAVSSLLTIALARAWPERRVRVVRSAEDALAAMERDSFALMIVDKNLPGASGFDLVRKMRALKYAVPVILVTGFFTPETSEVASGLGILACLPKP